MSLLTQQEIQDAVDAILESGLDIFEIRPALLASIHPAMRAVLIRSNMPRSQVVNDLGLLSDVERLADGSVPLQIYLGNAAFMLTGTRSESVIREILSRLGQTVSGSPSIDLDAIPEVKERIIFSDDTVPFAFMAGGVKAARSVMRLKVPRYDGGAVTMNNSGDQVIYNGTGWLLASTLLVTNHHVVNARNDGEPTAAEPDLLLQARGMVADLDYDFEGVQPVSVAIKDLSAWDEVLDYAVLEIEPTGREPLRCASEKVDVSSSLVPVNIVQHPGGQTKRFGIRNNLVSGATETDLRYFTDTEAGSSGSPVFNDRWEVVALHKASKYVRDAQFQGKTSAYVNIGTHIAMVLSDLRTRFPATSAQIGG